MQAESQVENIFEVEVKSGEVASMATRGNKLFGLFKPAPFKITKVGDPEQTLLDWTKYIRTFRRFLRVSKVSGTHTEDHRSCEGCKTEKKVLLMVGQDDV